MNAGKNSEERAADRTGFRAPSADFRMAAFWFWHRIPTGDEIRSQLADMQAKGIARVMIQARPALPIDEYLSPRYLAAYADAASHAQALGLGLTIYDEYGWMSGHGGGRTVQGADHLRERHLFWATAPAGNGTTVLAISGIHSGFLDFLGDAGRGWVYEGGSAVWGDWQPVLAAWRPGGPGTPPRTIKAITRITPTGPTSAEISVEHGQNVTPGMPITLFAAARCQTSRMVNYLLPETAERFADRVYAPLAKAAGHAADAFFFDHPYAGFYRWAEHHGALGNSLLWDEALLGGAAPDAARLMALIEGDGPAERALRADFLRDYARRLHEAFFGTLARWTAARGLGFTGHELLTHVGAWGLHEGLTGFDPRTMPGVDYFGIDGYRTVTAADSADYAPQLSARMGDSVARAHGRKRCIVEQYTTGRETGAPGLAGQWSLTAEKFRAQALRTLLTGARQIVLHALNVTDGAPGDGLFSPRFDFAPAYNFLPWWPDAAELFEEIARLSAFLEAGEPVTAVALFYPHATILAEGPASPSGTHFGWWAEALTRAGVGFHVVDESQFPALLAAPDRPDALILPAVTLLHRAASLDAIGDFCARGGRVVASGLLPGATLDAGAVAGAGLTGACHLPEADADGVARQVALLPRPANAPQVEGPGVWSATLATEAGWRLAAFNDTNEDRVLSVTLPVAKAEAEVWDCASGDIRPAPGLSGQRVIDLTLAPHQLTCLSIEHKGAAGRPDSAPPPPKTDPVPAEIVLDLGWTLAIGDGPARPVDVTRGWEVQGHPALAGTGLYARKIDLPALPDGAVWRLKLPGLHETATAFLGTKRVGTTLAGRRSIVLPAVAGPFELRLLVRNSAANHYYAGTPYRDGGPEPSGLTQPPVLAAEWKPST